MEKLSKLYDLIKEVDAQFIDFRFTDIKGMWHHVSMPVDTMSDQALKEGVFFDGSSIDGWQTVDQSDLLLKPDLDRIAADPFATQPSIIIICDVFHPDTRQPYERCPRTIAKKAEAYLKESGLADYAYFAPEAEFFIFDGVRFSVESTASFYELSADENPSANAEAANDVYHGHRPHAGGGYFPVPPIDSLSDMRAEMVTMMMDMGLSIEKHHHEVAPSQHEIGVKYSTLVGSVDDLQIYKYVVKNVAHSYGKTATFMPKPIYGDNGSGMHVHQSLWRKEKPLFQGKEYAGLSKIALYYIGGILKHAPALNAFTNPTTNSYKRLVSGFEAPVVLGYSAKNRSAACRIPAAMNDRERRIELRFADPSSNGYLSFSAMLLAGLDGIRNKIHPGDPSEGNLFDRCNLAVDHRTVSRSLRQALMALSEDRGFLTSTGVFSDDFIDQYIALKMEEVDQVDTTPNPMEFKLYYSI